MKKASDILEEIKRLRDQDVENWISQRIELLEKMGFDSDGISLNYFQRKRNKADTIENTEVEGYIPSNVGIRPDNSQINSLGIDDFDIYKKLVDDIKKENAKTPQQITWIIQKLIVNYFGGLSGDENGRDETYRFFQSSTFDEDGFPTELVHLKNFKNQNNALCVERSSVAQNLLSFLGYKSMMTFGILLNGSNEESHAFNILEAPDNSSGMLIDFTNPNFVNGYWKLNATLLNKDELEAFRKGKGVKKIKHVYNNQETEFIYGSSKELVRYTNNSERNEYINKKKLYDLESSSQQLISSLQSETGKTKISHI